MASIDWRRLATWILAAAVVVGLMGEPKLGPFYISFATLQALDVASTSRAIDRGGREANPIVAGVWGSPTGVAALKGSATAGLIYAAERLRKQKPKAALFVMIAANSAMAAVVAHNVANARR